jgi:hypothetical protein
MYGTMEYTLYSLVLINFMLSRNHKNGKCACVESRLMFPDSLSEFRAAAGTCFPEFTIPLTVIGLLRRLGTAQKMHKLTTINDTTVYVTSSSVSVTNKIYAVFWSAK